MIWFCIPSKSTLLLGSPPKKFKTQEMKTHWWFILVLFSHVVLVGKLAVFQAPLFLTGDGRLLSSTPSQMTPLWSTKLRSCLIAQSGRRLFYFIFFRGINVQPSEDSREDQLSETKLSDRVRCLCCIFL